ncbi:MAG TPA: hypothetical protein VE571_03515 [Solirubrobacteraceae bacterium]|nr:hypothetical protein [Solirubrobacteraceae bacterium]
MSRMAPIGAALDRLRPAPYRGDVTAAGAIPLALAAIVIELRMTQWSVGVRLIVVALIVGLILTMGWLTPLEGQTPSQYHSMLLIAGLLPLLLALQLLAEALGAQRPPGSGGQMWTFGVEAAVAGAAARRANSAACTLIAALSGAVAVEAFVAWVFDPQGAGTFRVFLFLLTLALAAGAVRLRDGHRRHAVALVNAAGLLTLVLALSYVIALSITVVPALGTRHGAAPFGWKLFILAMGFGLIAYAGADREPGPAYIGVVLLLAFALLVGAPVANGASLVGWPLFLLALGAVGLFIGLRPSTPAPPPPPADVAPTIPLRENEA